MAFWLVTCALPPALSAAEGDLAQAKHLLLSGKYAEAAEIYQRQSPETPAAAMGLARSLAAQGKLDEAARVLTSAAGDHAEVSADLHAELARLAFERGDYEAARTHADGAIRLDPAQLLARWIQGELFRTSGKLKEAEDAYLWLVRFYNEHGREVNSAESLRWIGLAAAQRARWNRLSDQFHFLVGRLYPEAIALEPDYWPAHYEAGLLFLEKYNQADAAAELNAALEQNPNAAEVHVALARLALQDRQVDKAQAHLAAAKEINPNLLELRLVLADLAGANFQPQEAIELLTGHALRLNPVSEEALGRLAACYVLLDGLPAEGQDTRFTRLVHEVTARNEHAGEFFFTLAGWLKERDKRPEAEQFFQEAIRRMPRLVGPRSELGLMLMDAGEEPRARELLEEAFDADPFNVRVDNMLKVLDLLDEMDTLETANCILRFDGGHDELLARYAARHVDAVYPALCERFGYRPPGLPLVEIFREAHGVSGPQWFGTRMIGLPYLGTVAASTGRIAAMVSPSEPGLSRPFNWAQTLTHELVHVITLQQTHFNVPHWYTEGLAVWSEGHPRPAEWNELLLRRVPAGELFDLGSINFAFTRPDSSDDWTMAYCQALLYVEYMLQGRSPAVLREMLSAYADNLDTGQAIERVFGVSQDEFEQGYVEFLKKTVAGLSAAGTPRSKGFAELLKELNERPDDPDLLAEVASGYVDRGAFREALDAADRALTLHPKHQLATCVVARLYVRAGRTEQAVKRLEECLDREAPDLRVLRLLAGLKFKAKEYAEAAQLYQLGAEKDWNQAEWLAALARVYLASGDEDRLAEVLAQIARGDPDDLATRKKLAQLSLTRGDFEAAANWANQALQINVADAEVHRAFAEALVGRHNYGEARRVLEDLLRLKPDDAGARTLLQQIEEKDDR